MEKNSTDFNESQWENEIRRHENNIADFFQDLVYCLDLPLAEQLVDPMWEKENQAANDTDALKKWMLDHDDADCCSDFEPRQQVCFSCVDSLDQLCVLWNQYSIKSCRDDASSVFALGISCAFAKLLARTADFTEPDKSCNTPLLKTLGKRAVRDLEDLVSRMDFFEQNFTIDVQTARFFRSRLALLRDQLADRIGELRSTPF